MERKQIDRHLTLEGEVKPSTGLVVLGWILILSWAALDLLWKARIVVIWLLIVAGILGVIYLYAEAGEPWQPTKWRGERSTVELDCEEIGLFLAPWGVDGGAINCVSEKTLNETDWSRDRFWLPTRDEFMHRYCSFHHGTSMAHFDPMNYIFWCHKVQPKEQGS